MNGNEFRAAVAKKGLSIPKLAEITGIKKKRIYSKLKNGKFNQEEILAFRKALGLTDSDIITIFFDGEVS